MKLDINFEPLSSFSGLITVQLAAVVPEWNRQFIRCVTNAVIARQNPTVPRGSHGSYRGR